MPQTSRPVSCSPLRRNGSGNWSSGSSDLSTKEYVYLWADAVYFTIRLDNNDRQCILVLIGATKDGHKELVAVQDGFRERWELSDDDRRMLLEEIIEHLEDAARFVRELDDEYLRAYCLADLEGQAGGWLGTFVRDHLNEALHAINAGEGAA